MSSKLLVFALDRRVLFHDWNKPLVRLDAEFLSFIIVF